MAHSKQRRFDYIRSLKYHLVVMSGARINVIQPQIRNLISFLLPLPDKKPTTAVVKRDKTSGLDRNDHQKCSRLQRTCNGYRGNGTVVNRLTPVTQERNEETVCQVRALCSNEKPTTHTAKPVTRLRPCWPGANITQFTFWRRKITLKIKTLGILFSKRNTITCVEIKKQ